MAPFLRRGDKIILTFGLNSGDGVSANEAKAKQWTQMFAALGVEVVATIGGTLVPGVVIAAVFRDDERTPTEPVTSPGPTVCLDRDVEPDLDNVVFAAEGIVHHFRKSPSDPIPRQWIEQSRDGIRHAMDWSKVVDMAKRSTICAYNDGKWITGNA